MGVKQKVEVVNMTEHTITAGPVHDRDEIKTAYPDANEPCVDTNKVVVMFIDYYKEVLSYSGHWRWCAEWRVIPIHDTKQIIQNI